MILINMAQVAGGVLLIGMAAVSVLLAAVAGLGWLKGGGR